MVAPVQKLPYKLANGGFLFARRSLAQTVADLRKLAFMHPQGIIIVVAPPWNATAARAAVDALPGWAQDRIQLAERIAR